MINEKEYLQSIKDNGLTTTWQLILTKYFPNDYFTEDKLGGLYELGLATENKIEKKSMGKYYTPDDVAIVMAQYFLELPGTNIVDLCCGTGNLIFAVLNELGEERAKQEIAAGHIYLYDIDETAVSICLAILRNRYGDIVDKINVIIQDCIFSPVSFPEDAKIISNPPYGKNTNLIKTKLTAAARTKELYVAFFETALNAKIPMVIITPHSFLGGSTFKDLRKELYGGKIFAFDNVPGNIFKGKKFGIFNSNEANSTRAAISILDPQEKNLYLAPFIRFKTEERSEVINKEFLDSLISTYAQINDGEILYRIAPGTEEIVSKWFASKKNFGSLLTTQKTDYVLDIPNTCRYYTSGAKRTLKRTGKMTVYCKDEDSFYLAYAFANSSLCYYYHRICNGGVTYPVTLLKAMPVFGEATPELKAFCNTLITNEETNLVLKKNAGAFQENIKIPMQDRIKLNNLLLEQIGLKTTAALIKVHSNSCFSNNTEEDEE